MPRVPASFIRTNTTNLPSIPVVDGQYILVCNPATGEGEYVAFDDSTTRNKFLPVQDLAIDADRLTITPSVFKFYYVKATDMLWRYVDNTWICLNDTSTLGRNIYAASISDLPSVGSKYAIYIVKDTHKMYYWDDTAVQYCTADTYDWHDIELINGTFN